MILDVDEIFKSFGSVQALRGASLQLQRGAVTALVGDNGAGKSTLVKVMSGVSTADSGTVRVDGREVEFRNPSAARDAGIHTVFQDLALVGSMSVRENMFLGTEVHRRAGRWTLPFLDSDRMGEETRAALANLGITTLSNVETRIENLSGGQRQTVAIARAVRESATVVILDEPTAALGVTQAAEVLGLIRRLRNSGTAVLVVSHNLREVFDVADWIVVLRLGIVAATFDAAATTEEQVVSAIVGATR